MNPTPDAPVAPYLLFFRNTGVANYKHLSAEERQLLIQRWNSWYDDLQAEGKASNGQPLEESTRLVTGPAGERVVDGPFPETKEAIGGYVMLHVSTLDEATAHAQRHPGLAYGMQIEIRQLITRCHLGITRKAPAAAVSTPSPAPAPDVSV